MRSKPGAKPGLRRQAGKRFRRKTTRRSQSHRPSSGTDPPRLGHELEVHQSEQFARATIDALTAHICILDETGTIIAVNESWRAFARANQLTAQQAGAGVNYLAVCDAATGSDSRIASAFAAGMRAVMRGKRDEFAREYACHSPSEQRWFLGRVTRFSGPGLVRLVVAHENITERKQIEASLRESEAAARARADELATMLAATPAITFIAHDRNCRRMTSSRVALRLLRLLDGANSSKSAPPGERPETFRAMKNGRELRPEELPVQLAATTGHAVRNFELTLVFDDGTARDIVGDAVPFFDAEGGVRGAVGAFLDITDRKQAEEALHELSGRLLRSQDEERRRIARELHDTTAQGLAALLMNLSLVKASTPGMSDKTRQLLAEAVTLAEQCTRELRTVSYLLHPPMLDELGLAGAMRDYADGFARRSGLRIDLELPPDLEGLPRETELALFRVMQEALTNVHLHSCSRTASILLGRTATELQLEVRDQGRGMEAARKLSAGDPPGGGLGVGVPGMRERMRQLGGRLEIESNDRGTCVIAIAPVTGRAPAQLQP